MNGNERIFNIEIPKIKSNKVEVWLNGGKRIEIFDNRVTKIKISQNQLEKSRLKIIKLLGINWFTFHISSAENSSVLVQYCNDLQTIHKIPFHFYTLFYSSFSGDKSNMFIQFGLFFFHLLNFADLLFWSKFHCSKS